MIKKIKNNQKGAALVETAITLPMIVMLVFGMLYYAQIIKDSLVMQTAAREGARNYAVYYDRQEAVNIARKELANGKVEADVYIINKPPDKGMGIQKDVVLSVPFTEVHIFTLRNEVILHREDHPDYYKEIYGGDEDD